MRSRRGLDRSRNSRSLDDVLGRSCRLHWVNHRLRLSIHARPFRHVRVLGRAGHVGHLPSVLRPCCRRCKRHGGCWVLDPILIHCIRCWSRWNILALNLLKVGINGGRHTLELPRRLPIVHRARWRRRWRTILLNRVSGGRLRSHRHCSRRLSFYARRDGLQMNEMSFKHVE
jgi:hypothetical protein